MINVRRWPVIIVLGLIAWAILLLPIAAFADGLFIAPPNTTESSVKHVATGAAIGAAGGLACNALTRKAWGYPAVGECALAVVGSGVFAYAVKEFAFDAVQYNGGKGDVRDFIEGVGGVTVGAVFSLQVD